MILPSISSPSAPLYILIADDDVGDRAQIRRSLSTAGLRFEAVEVGSLEEALAACEENLFDCAVVDYLMPSQDGLTGITLLHKRLPSMVIIMATGHGDEMIATEAMKRGASDYIGKSSITPDSIKRAVGSALEKAALARLVAAQREELENFASILAHDLYAPIASIELFVQTLSEDIQADMPDREEVFQLCRATVGAAQRAGMLIDTLRRYTKADAVVMFTRVDMRHAMNSALENLKFLIEGRDARVTFDVMPCVIGDPSLLIQLLQNLIGNAIKYCAQPQPVVHLAVVRDADDDWLFSLSDNGIGIPKEQLSKIFEPFTRLHVNGVYDGSGLGLAICKKLIGRHGGSIWCQSPGAGKGSTFFFKLHGSDNLDPETITPPFR